MGPGFGLLVAAVVGSVAYLFALVNGRERAKHWRLAAARAGLGQVTSREFLGIETKLTGVADGLDVTLQRYQRGRHERGTRIVIGGLRHGTYALTLRPEGVTSRIEKSFGEREIELGDPAFDDAAYVQGAPSLVRAVFDAETRRLVRQLIDGVVRADGVSPRKMSRFRLKVANDELRLELRSSPLDRTEDLLPDILKPLVEIGQRLKRPHDVATRLAENTRHEPLETVRLANLRTLVTEFARHEVTRGALLDGLSDTSAAVRLLAASSLGPDGRGVLEALAQDDEDVIAAKAVSALGETFGPARAAERLLRARAEGHVATAKACIEVLGATRAATSVDLLAEVLTAGDADLAESAAQALGRVGHASVEGPLVGALDHPAERVRVVAAEALGRVGTPLAVVPLRAAAAQHRLDGALRKAVREAIVEIQGRVTGATPGQISLADGEAGQVSLVDEDVRGRVSIDEERQDNQEQAVRRATRAARRQAQ